MSSTPQKTENQPFPMPRAIIMDKDDMGRDIIFQPIANKKVAHDALKNKDEIRGVISQEHPSKDDFPGAVPTHNTAPLTSDDIKHEMNILDTGLRANKVIEHERHSLQIAPLIANDVISNDVPLQNTTPPVNNQASEDEWPSLDPALRSFMVKKAYEYIDPAKWKGKLGLEDATLCEVLELDEDAIATINPEDRKLIFKEAKLNIGKWDHITPYQRTDVNLTIARMKIHEEGEENEEYLNNLPREKRVAYFMEINSNLEKYGQYEAVEFNDVIGQRDIRFEWVSNYARNRELGQPSRKDLDFEQYYGFILELATREMGWFKNEQELVQLRLCNLPGLAPEEFLDDVLRHERIHLQRGCEVRYCETLARAKFIRESEAMKQQPEPLIDTRGSPYDAELIRAEVEEVTEQDQVSPRGPTLSLRPYYLPDGKVVHLRSPAGHRYPLEKCKMIVNGNDINESLGKRDPPYHTQDLEQAADGTGLIGNWLMGFYYENDVDDL